MEENKIADEKEEVNPFQEEGPKNEDHYLDIAPIGKGRRILVFLADFFIAFITAVFIFSFAVFPIYKVACNYSGIKQTISSKEDAQLDVLHDNSLLYTENASSDTYDFTSDIEYTEKRFVNSCINDTYEENVFYTYYVTDLGKSLEDLNTIYKNMDIKGFFEVSNGKYVLKDEFKTSFAPVLNSKDELSSTGKVYYSNFTSTFFLPFYKVMIDDIISGDSLTEESPIYQYRVLDEEANALNDKADDAVVASSYIAFGITLLILYLMVPLISKKGQTFGMMIMKVERVGQDNLGIIRKGERAIQCVYQLVLNLPFILFVPMAYVSFTYLFNLPKLYLVSFISSVYLIVSLIFLLCSHFNKTLTDYLTKTVMIDTDSLDKIYKVRGYGNCY